MRAAAVVGLCLVGSAITSAASIDAWFVGDDLGEIHRARVGDTRRAHVRPLVTLLLRASRGIGGLDPVAYHLVGVVLHALVIGLVAWVAATLARRGGFEEARVQRVAVLAAVTFALLATHSEAVSWISTHGDLVVAAGGLLAVGAWVRREDDRRWTWVAVAGLVAALASKEHAVAIPLLCLVVGLGAGDGGPGRLARAVRDAVPLFAVLAAYVAIRAVVIGAVVGSYEDSGGFDWHPVHLVGGFAAMVVRTLVPGVGERAWVVVAVLAGVALVVGGLGRATVRRALVPAARSTAGLAAVLVLVALLPAAGLGVSLTDVRGDRLLYLASAFASIAVAALAVSVVDAIARRAGRIAAVGLLAALLVVSGAAAVERDLRWAHAGELSEATLRTGPMWRTERDVVVLNPADDLQGAYVHRNTLGDAAVVVHGWSAPSRVAAVAPMTVHDADAPVAVRPLGSRRWLLVPAAGRARFLRGAGGSRTWYVGGVSARLRDDGTLAVSVDPDVALTDVWYLSAGHLHPLADVG